MLTKISQLAIVGVVLVAVGLGIGIPLSSVGAQATRTESHSCTDVKAEVDQMQPGWSQHMSCAKAMEFVAPGNIPNPVAPTAPKEPKGYVPPPIASPQPSADAGKIITNANDPNGSLGEMATDPSHTITAMWHNVDANYVVYVLSGVSSPGIFRPSGSYPTPSQGFVKIMITNGLNLNPLTMNGYSGGTYMVPGSSGAVMLSSVSGSLSAGDMVITFTDANGTGTFTPAMKSFSG